MTRRLRRPFAGPRRVALATTLALGGACVTVSETPRPPTGDELLAAGNALGAAAAYEREAAAATDASERARARLLWAVALLSSKDPLLERQGLELLRQLEDAPDGWVWTPVARALSLEISRAEVLRRTIMRAGADVQELRTRLELCDEQLAQRGADNEALEEQRAAVAEELAAAQRRMRELEAELAARKEQLLQLEGELSALKDIDMQRDP